MDYKKMLAKVLGEKELMEIDVQGIKDDESLFHELVNRKAILLLKFPTPSYQLFE